MSAATEIANAEADEVEAELGPDEELEPDGETEQEPEPEVEQESEASMQARLKKISAQMDGEDKRHEKRYAEILGDDFGMYAPCPLCQLAGFAFTYPPGSMPDEQRQAVALVLGELGPRVLKESPYSVQCETCGGEGVYLTGAKADHSKELTCSDCNGQGWIPKVTPATGRHLAAVPSAGQAQAAAVAAGQPPFDTWGRPAGHERFGIDLQYTGGTW